MKPVSLRGWVRGFATSAFIMGLVILPIDVLWVSLQWLKFGGLHPDEWLLVLSCYARDILGIMLCVIMTWDELKRGVIDVEKLVNLWWILPFYALWFGLAPDPSWTDWTYAIRFNTGHVFESFLVSHGVLKLVQALIYGSLWREKPVIILDKRS